MGELWWERYARLRRAADELLAGVQDAPHHQAQEAARISAENPAVDQLGITLSEVFSELRP